MSEWASGTGPARLLTFVARCCWFARTAAPSSPSLGWADLALAALVLDALLQLDEIELDDSYLGRVEEWTGEA